MHSTAAASGPLKQAVRLSGFPDLTELYFSKPDDFQPYFVLDDKTVLYARAVENVSLTDRNSAFADRAMTINIYAFDLATSKSTFLFGQRGAASGFFTDAAPPVEFERIGNGLIVAVLGSLFRTNGSAAGSIKLLERGLGFCCGSASDDVPRLKIVGKHNGVVYLNVDEELERGHSLPVSSRLWRSDGTLQGTYPISIMHTRSAPDSSYYGTRSAFAGRINGEAWVYYLLNSGRLPTQLWRSRDKRGLTQSELVFDFGKTRRSNNVVQLGANHFFCIEPSGVDSQTKLMRLAADGRVSVVTTGCDPNTLSTFNGFIYYYSRDGQIWRSAGSAINTSPVYPVANSPLTFFSSKSTCKSSSGLFYLANSRSGADHQNLFQLSSSGQFVEIGAEVGLDIKAETNQASYSDWNIAACADTGLLFERIKTTIIQRVENGSHETERVASAERVFLDSKIGQASRLVGGNGFATIAGSQITSENLDVLEYASHPIVIRRYIPPMAPIIMELIE